MSRYNVLSLICRRAASGKFSLAAYGKLGAGNCGTARTVGTSRESVRITYTYV